MEMEKEVKKIRIAIPQIQTQRYEFELEGGEEKIIEYPCESLTRIFNRVEKETVDYGIVPVENSISGTVVQTYDLLLERDLRVVGEIKLKIAHCLISFPENGPEDIRKVYAHPRAWLQCRDFRRQHPSWKYIPTHDTADSVRIIQEEKIRDAAAIASQRAADICGMKILYSGIENPPYDITRFFVISKEALKNRQKNNKSSLVFATRNHAGALYECLGEFAKRGINLTKLESRPRPNRPWEHVFYLDFEGNLEDDIYIQAIAGLLKQAAFVKVLGSYLAAP